MSCERIRFQLTAYLDGDVDADQGSAIRGHLRGCEACRRVANDEAVLRDGLRAMPSVDPPSSMWAGVQARLAAAEVADSKKPAWRRAVSRWLPAITPMRFATGGVVMAAAVTLIWWKTRATEQPVDIASSNHGDVITAGAGSDRVALQQPDPPTTAAGDVTKDIAQDAAREGHEYEVAADELVASARQAHDGWTDEQKASFDLKITKLRAVALAAPEGRARNKAWRELTRFAQGAAIRDVVAMHDAALANGAHSR